MFDIWIGNADRKNNLKAFVASPHTDLFVGFDHGAALLGFEDDPTPQLQRLASDELLLRFHPFFGHVSASEVAKWVRRIESVSDQEIVESCVFGKPFRAVPMGVQSALAGALIKRKARLASIVQANSSHIGI